MIREHTAHIVCCGIHTVLETVPLRFVANYAYLRHNDMKRLLVIISSTHKDFNLHEMS